MPGGLGTVGCSMVTHTFDRSIDAVLVFNYWADRACMVTTTDGERGNPTRLRVAGCHGIMTPTDDHTAFLMRRNIRLFERVSSDKLHLDSNCSDKGGFLCLVRLPRKVRRRRPRMLCCNKTAVGCCQDTRQSRQDQVAGLGNAESIFKSRYDINTYTL